MIRTLICVGLILAAYQTGYWTAKVDAAQAQPVALCLNDDSVRALKLARKPIPQCIKVADVR